MATPAIHVYNYNSQSVPQLGGMDAVVLNYMQNPFVASAVVDIISGTANFAIEFSTDDMSGLPSTFRWLTLPGITSGQTATLQYTINFPVTAVRLNLATLTGLTRFTVIQSPASTR